MKYKEARVKGPCGWKAFTFCLRWQNISSKQIKKDLCVTITIATTKTVTLRDISSW